MSTQIPKPRIIAFELTRRCPLSCRHCRAGATADVPDLLDTNKCRRILRSIADFNRCIVVLTGGEPMTRQDVFELVRFGSELRLKIAVATCGYYITPYAIKKLKDAGIFSLSFSLDSSESAEHDAFRQSLGSFSQVLSAAKFASEAGVSFQINTTITAANLHRVPAIAALARKLGAGCFNPFILVPVGRADDIKDLIILPDQYEKLLADLAELKNAGDIEVRVTCGPQFARIARQKNIAGSQKVGGCLAATGFAFISAAGDVQTCGFLNISAGNLVGNNYDFADIWYNSPLLKKLRDHSNYKGVCAGCAYLNYCRGCRARAYTMLGDYLEQDPVCKIVQSHSSRKERL